MCPPTSGDRKGTAKGTALVLGTGTRGTRGGQRGLARPRRKGDSEGDKSPAHRKPPAGPYRAGLAPSSRTRCGWRAAVRRTVRTSEPTAPRSPRPSAVGPPRAARSVAIHERRGVLRGVEVHEVRREPSGFPPQPTERSISADHGHRLCFVLTSRMTWCVWSGGRSTRHTRRAGADQYVEPKGAGPRRDPSGRARERGSDARGRGATGSRRSGPRASCCRPRRRPARRYRRPRARRPRRRPTGAPRRAPSWP